MNSDMESCVKSIQRILEEREKKREKERKEYFPKLLEEASNKVLPIPPYTQRFTLESGEYMLTLFNGFYSPDEDAGPYGMNFYLWKGTEEEKEKYSESIHDERWEYIGEHIFDSKMEEVDEDSECEAGAIELIEGPSTIDEAEPEDEVMKKRKEFTNQLFNEAIDGLTYHDNICSEFPLSHGYMAHVDMKNDTAYVYVSANRLVFKDDEDMSYDILIPTQRWVCIGSHKFTWKFI